MYTYIVFNIMMLVKINIYYNIVIEHEDVTINDHVISINKLIIIKI